MTDRTPVIFLSHGNPMVALDPEAGREYAAWSKTLATPRALLIFSAHWEEDGLVAGETCQHDELIYDFYGFPTPLYELQYPAPGAPWLLEQVRELLGEATPQRARGLDHGVWVPLLHMWPEANVPVLQLSLPRLAGNRQLRELGRRLAPLRDHGVMIVGAGTLTHNLHEGLRGHHDSTPAWVRAFDEWTAAALLEDRERLLQWERAPEALRNHPTPEHFRPLLITVGAAAPDEQPGFPTLGYDMHIFSKRSVQFG